MVQALQDIELQIENALGNPDERLLKDVIRFLTGRGKKSELRRVEFKREFDGSTRAWVRILAELAAMSNSGGGIVIFGVADDGTRVGLDHSLLEQLDPARVQQRLRNYASAAEISFSMTEFSYQGRLFCALAVASTPRVIVFDRDGNYNEQGRTRDAFKRGVVYVRRPGGKAPATQADMNDLLQELTELHATEFLTRIERVVHLPEGAALVAVSPTDSSAGVRLSGDGTGVPITLTDTGLPAVPVTEVLSPEVPFSSLEADVVAQVRHWKQQDPGHRLKKTTLSQWFARRREYAWDQSALELALLSTLRERGFPNWWAKQLRMGSVADIVSDVISSNAFPDREILPYLIATQLWGRRHEFWNALRDREPGLRVERTISKLASMSRADLLENSRVATHSFRFDDNQYSLKMLYLHREEAETVLEVMVAADAESTLGPSARPYAQQLDMYLYSAQSTEE